MSKPRIPSVKQLAFIVPLRDFAIRPIRDGRYDGLYYRPTTLEAEFYTVMGWDVKRCRYMPIGDIEVESEAKELARKHVEKLVKKIHKGAYHRHV